MKPGDLFGPKYGPTTTTKTGPGKGSTPRSNASGKFRDNYDSIDWGKPKKSKARDVAVQIYELAKTGELRTVGPLKYR